MEKVCKNCKFWKKPDMWWGGKQHYCDRVDRISPIIFETRVKVMDDSGLSVKLETGPDFGCVLFESRK